MEQRDRDMLIRMDERQQNLMKLMQDHMTTSKLSHDKVIEKLDEHSNRLTMLETKSKPWIIKLFTALFAVKGA